MEAMRRRDHKGLPYSTDAMFWILADLRAELEHRPWWQGADTEYSLRIRQLAKDLRDTEAQAIKDPAWAALDVDGHPIRDQEASS